MHFGFVQFLVVSFVIVAQAQQEPEPIVCGGSITASNVGLPSNLGQPSGDVLYVFVMNEPAFVNISTCSPATEFDTYLTLKPDLAKSSQTAFNDDSDNGCGLSAEIVGFLPAGTYFILAEGFEFNEGIFELTVTCQETVFPLEQIHCGESVVGSNVGRLPFSGPSGGVVYELVIAFESFYKMSTCHSNSEYEVHVFADSGLSAEVSQFVFFQDTTDDTCYEPRQIGVLLSPGAYYVEVAGQFPFSEGDFLLEPNCQVVPIGKCGDTISLAFGEEVLRHGWQSYATTYFEFVTPLEIEVTMWITTTNEGFGAFFEMYVNDEKVEDVEDYYDDDYTKLEKVIVTLPAGTVFVEAVIGGLDFGLIEFDVEFTCADPSAIVVLEEASVPESHSSHASIQPLDVFYLLTAGLFYVFVIGFCLLKLKSHRKGQQRAEGNLYQENTV